MFLLICYSSILRKFILHGSVRKNWVTQNAMTTTTRKPFRYFVRTWASIDEGMRSCAIIHHRCTNTGVEVLVLALH